MLKVALWGVFPLLILTGLTPPTMAQSHPLPLQISEDNQEFFELDIQERLIREQDYRTNLRVEIDSLLRNAVQVTIGASVRAEQAEILLRDVEGKGIFYSNLESLENIRELENFPQSN